MPRPPRLTPPPSMTAPTASAARCSPTAARRLAAVGDYTTAAQCVSAATQDASLCHAVQGLSGPGQCPLFQSGDYANAGTAFRQAAIDGANPAPAAALGELGRCFIKLGRPADAVETYRTAIDFAGPATTRVRSMPAWVRRFLPPAVPPTHSTPLTPLLPMASTSSPPSRPMSLPACMIRFAALSAQTAMATAPAPAMDAPAVDPLDPTGATGQFMPDPSDTGFFYAVRVRDGPAGPSGSGRPRSVVAIATRASKSSSCCFCSF